MLGKLTLAMRPRAARHTKRAGHGFGAIEARVLERRGREVAEAIPRDRADGAHSLSVSPFYFLYHAPVFDVVFEAHDLDREAVRLLRLLDDSPSIASIA